MIFYLIQQKFIKKKIPIYESVAKFEDTIVTGYEKIYFEINFLERYIQINLSDKTNKIWKLINDIQE